VTAWRAYGGRGAVGVWLVGARGPVATTAIAGAAALGAGLVRPTGCVTARREFASLDLPRFDDLVFGGHDDTGTGLLEGAERLAEEGVMPPGLPRLVREGLLAAEKEIRPGAPGTGGARCQEETVRALTEDLLSFRRRHGLARVVVVDLSSPGPVVPRHPAHASLSELRRALTAGEDVLPAGSLYACAALRADCSYVGFTPSAGLRLPALRELAAERGLPYAGGAGRTGQALLRSVLEPVFGLRALTVRSWSASCPADGENGNEGESENGSEDGSGREGGDRVTFEGFLGAQVSLEFAWRSREPVLAAPLVLDLARLMALADRAGVRGPVPELAFFFEDPVLDGPAADRRSPGEQYAALVAWAHGLRVPV